MRNKIFVLCGKSGSGKDAISKEIIKDFGFLPIISDTTRPMRIGEQEGIEYYFKTLEEFDAAIIAGKYLEHRTYNTIENKQQVFWKYGTRKESIDLTSTSNIMIPDIEGLKSMQNIFGPQVIAIYIDVDDKIREERARARGSFDEDEWDRRIKDDKVKFSKNIIDSSVDYIVNNNGDFNSTLSLIKNIILTEVKE